MLPTMLPSTSTLPLIALCTTALIESLLETHQSLFYGFPLYLL
jgi:hypothetical protein